MATLPLCVIFLTGKTSFIISCIIVLLQGLANAVSLSCLYAIISHLPHEYIIAFTTGNGLAGILINVIRYLILALLGDPDEESNIIIGSIIFFSVSALIILIGLIFIFVVYSNPFFIYRMRDSGEFELADYVDYLSSEEKDKESLSEEVINPQGEGVC